MRQTSVLRIDRILLVTLHDDTRLAEARDFLIRLGETIAASSAIGVLVDVSGLALVDSYIGRMLATIVGTARLLGAEAMIAGVRPEIAISMVELGIELPDIPAALDVDAGLASLRGRIGHRR
jgi:rsbT antagonist protein RsbS